MPDMYDKLGELLNEALESGEIPQNDKRNAVVEPVETTAFFNEKVVSTSSTTTNTSSTATNSSSTNKNSCSKTTKRIKIPKKDQKTTGEVIKMHKYTTFMQFPPQIQQALHTLDIVYPVTQDKIKRQYHKKLKEFHPDTKADTPISGSTVNKNRQYTVDEITFCYNLLSTYFNSL